MSIYNKKGVAGANFRGLGIKSKINHNRCRKIPLPAKLTTILKMYWNLLVISLVPVALAATASQDIGISVKDTTASNIVNIHLKYPDAALKEHVFTYGDCGDLSYVSPDSTIAHVSGAIKPGDDTRLVWVVPDDVSSGGCISAWEQNKALIGRSPPLALDGILRQSLAKRDRILMTNESGIDAEGPWFNGVTLLKNKEIGTVDVKKAKSKGAYNIRYLIYAFLTMSSRHRHSWGWNIWVDDIRMSSRLHL